MIHRKILDVAQAQPDASLETIADNVSGGSAEFVRRVLEEYGDPAGTSSRPERTDGRGNTDVASNENSVSRSLQNSNNAVTNEADDMDPGSDTADSSTDTEVETVSESSKDADQPPATEPSESSTKESQSAPTLSDLSDKQIETLRAVREEPAATQEEIADRLDVTRATISKRVNDIQGFSWKTRRQFVTRLFDAAAPEPGGSESASGRPAAAAEIAELEARVESLENESKADSERESEPVFDAELAHKVVHACMDADYVSESEELKLLKKLL